jgi:hypothetical protein
MSLSRKVTKVDSKQREKKKRKGVKEWDGGAKVERDRERRRKEREAKERVCR